MSEDFDREAERERLREKYEKDKQEREATEQMSELLLQGATMTNGHCAECGDPIFRYDGQEFCPTCEKPVDAQDGADDGEEDGIEVRSPSDDGRVAFGSDGAAEQTADAQQPRPDQGQPTHPQPGQEQPGESRQDQPQQDSSQTESQTREQSHEVPGITPETGDLASAEQSLVDALARFSEQAAATEDPRKAKDHLAAAKEAAQALDALRQ